MPLTDADSSSPTNLPTAETRGGKKGGGGVVEAEEIAVTDDVDQDKVTLLVYWEGRLVPQTIVKELPLFKPYKEARKCFDAGVPIRWRRRVCGQIFLDSTFQHIANNKIKLNLPGGQTLEGWLNHYSSELLSNQLKELFKRFVSRDRDHIMTFLSLSTLCLFRFLQDGGKADQEFTLSEELGNDPQGKVKKYAMLKLGSSTVTRDTVVRVALNASRKHEIWVTPLRFELEVKHLDSQVRCC